jgi:hypothetical protein
VPDDVVVEGFAVVLVATVVVATDVVVEGFTVVVATDVVGADVVVTDVVAAGVVVDLPQPLKIMVLISKMAKATQINFFIFSPFVFLAIKLF